MDFLSNNYIFNTGGWITTFAFLGAKTTKMMEYYPLLTFIIALLSVFFLVMRLYLTYLEIKEKKGNKDRKELEAKE